MAMLSRYQRPGGFIQILQLIETCGKQKQDNFLQMIEAEDKRWADAIKEKMLTMEKIFTWDDNTISEISSRLQELTLATAMHGLKPEETERLLRCFTHSQRRMIEDLHKEKAANTTEVTSAFVKIITEVRKMISQGFIRAEKFAPECLIPDGYEEKLGKSLPNQKVIDLQTSANTNSRQAPSTHSTIVHPSAAQQVQARSQQNGAAQDSADVVTLRNKILSLQNENNQLKQELKIYKEKIEQIRKIA